MVKLTSGEVLKLFRLSNNCTIVQLSKITEIPRRTLSRMELNEILYSYKKMNILASTYGISTKQLVRTFRELDEFDYENDFKLAMLRVIQIQLEAKKAQDLLVKQANEQTSDQ